MSTHLENLINNEQEIVTLCDKIVHSGMKYTTDIENATCQDCIKAVDTNIFLSFFYHKP